MVENIFNKSLMLGLNKEKKVIENKVMREKKRKKKLFCVFELKRSRRKINYFVFSF